MLRMVMLDWEYYYLNDAPIQVSGLIILKPTEDVKLRHDKQLFLLK